MIATVKSTIDERPSENNSLYSLSPDGEKLGGENQNQREILTLKKFSRRTKRMPSVNIQKAKLGTQNPWEAYHTYFTNNSKLILIIKYRQENKRLKFRIETAAISKVLYCQTRLQRSAKMLDSERRETSRCGCRQTQHGFQLNPQKSSKRGNPIAKQQIQVIN